MRTGLVFLCLLACCEAGATLEVRDAKNRPVTKVINLLKDMIKQLEKEGEEDQDIYEKMGCWCVTNEKLKKESVAAAQSRITELTATVEESASDYARLTAEVGNLDKEIADNTAALESATALRSKQEAEFNDEEKETLTSITSVKGAIQVLSKQHSASALLQQGASDEERINIMVSLRHALRQHRAKFQDSITPKERKMVEALASDKASFVQSGRSAYDPQSGAIFGIMKQMKEDFETNLANSQKEETSNVAAYEDLKAAKTTEIAAGQEQADTKSAQAAQADEKKANAKEDLEETRATLAADNKFLEDLMLKCQAMDQEFEERTSTRALEIQATSKALEFLSSDEAHDLFTRTFNPALVQRRNQVDSKRRLALEKLLLKSHDPRISALAVHARLDAFEEVKKTIKGMIDKLLKEKDDDIKHKDYCIDEFNTNEVNTKNKYREKDEVLAAIDNYHATIDELDKAIETLKADVQELEVNQKSASAEREKANADFQMVVADQEGTEKLLTAALKVLQGFYNKAALVQGKATASKAAVSKQAPPPGFKTYEKSAASGGVMGMMQKIIDEAKAMKAEALRGEEEAQASYEEFTKDTTESLAAKNKDIVSKSAAKAKAEKDAITAEEKRDTTLTEIEELAQIDADLHKSCDFLMKNFDIRVTSRDSEVEALKKGLALFSGASFGALLQRY